MARYAKSLGFAQRSTAPATPAEGNVEMYLMDDGKMYQKDSSGTESEVGGGGGIMGQGTALGMPIAGTETVTMDGTVKYTVATGDCTLNASGGVEGQTCTLIFYTQNSTTPYTITFGDYFMSTGTLSTGSAVNKYFAVTFVCYQGYWLETSRTTAM